MSIFLFFVVHWYLSLFFQTFFLHRYASHGMYRLNRFWERVFYLLTFLFQGSSFLHPAAYAVMHRRHHAYADTDKDPHSPSHVSNIFEFNKKTFDEYRVIVKQFAEDKIKANDVPRWIFMERLAELHSVRVLFVLIYILIYYYLSAPAWSYFLIPIHVLMGPIHGFIVNWFGHSVGYRNYKEIKDKSTNSLPIDFLMMGELYQNNHHKFPNKRNFALKWFELDIGYILASFFQKINVIGKGR